MSKKTSMCLCVNVKMVLVYHYPHNTKRRPLSLRELCALCVRQLRLLGWFPFFFSRNMRAVIFFLLLAFQCRDSRRLLVFFLELNFFF